MLKTLLKNAKFRSEIRYFYNKNKEKVLDIFLFGSIARGKEKPADLDILILFKEKEDLELEYELRKKLEKLNLGLKIEITTRNYRNLFDVRFLPKENILSEAYSLISNKKLSEKYGYESYILFKYSLKKLSISKKMMFNYALKGRRKEIGILKKIKGRELSISTILIPVENSERFEEFLNLWKLPYKKITLLVPERSIKFGEI